jgi:glycosyltransferase involved in cell wall biosynthesis
MQILLLEPFYTGSHKTWADQLIQHSLHNITLQSLKGKYWKWRMRGSAVTFSKIPIDQYDLILSSDMLDVACYRGLIKNHNIPLITYFHENQLSYPFQDINEHDRHFAYTNFTTALSSNQLLFNSDYHLRSFIATLNSFLNVFPDHREKELIPTLERKSRVLYPGIDDTVITRRRRRNEVPYILWNHRWEHDKNPDLFFRTLISLKEKGYDFKLIVLGESFARKPGIFKIANSELSDRIVHWGYAESKTEYYRLLAQSDILPTTSFQEFFGLSVIEAIASGVIPLLPSRLSYPDF